MDALWAFLTPALAASAKFVTSSQSFCKFPVPENTIFFAGKSQGTTKTPFSADSSTDEYVFKGFLKLAKGIDSISGDTTIMASKSDEFKSVVATIVGRSCIYRNIHEFT